MPRDEALAEEGTLDYGGGTGAANEDAVIVEAWYLKLLLSLSMVVETIAIAEHCR